MTTPLVVITTTVSQGEMAMLFMNLRGLLSTCLKHSIKGWVDIAKDQSCIPLPHRFKCVMGLHKINILHFK